MSEEKYRITNAGKAYTPADGDVVVRHTQGGHDPWWEWFTASNMAFLPAIENSRHEWRVMCGDQLLAFRDRLHIEAQYPDKTATMRDSLRRERELEAQIRAFEEALWIKP